MLVPLYEVTEHDGLRFARQEGLNVNDTIDELGKRVGRAVSLDTSASTLGVRKTSLLVKLGIFSCDLSAGNMRKAALRGRAGEVKMMLLFGADAASADSDGETALHQTTDAETARVLCEGGSPIAALDGDGNTTIAKAAAYNWKEVLGVLLAQDGARDILNKRNKFGKAAVHYARNRPEILAMLVEAGADPDLSIALQ